MENNRFHLAGEKIYHYIWHELADKIIEDSKVILNNEDETDAKLAREQLLLRFLADSLIILHPFMPFITEEIWQIFNFNNSLLMIEPWPYND